MFNSPTRHGFSLLPRPMSNLTKEKMAAPNNAYYVLTEAHAGLPNSVLFSDLSHTVLQDIGTNTHAEIDTHIADTSNPHSTALDDIENPAGDTTFTFAANKHLHLFWTGAAVGDDGQFEIEGRGGWRGDLIHVHQHTGAIPVPSDLLHLEAESANVTNIRLNNAAATNVLEVGPLGSPVLGITNLGIITWPGGGSAATNTHLALTNEHIDWTNATENFLTTGSGTFDSMTINGKTIIDVNSTEALLIRKDGDGGDVLVVDTVNGRFGINIAPTISSGIRFFASPGIPGFNGEGMQFFGGAGSPITSGSADKNGGNITATAGTGGEGSGTATTSGIGGAFTQRGGIGGKLKTTGVATDLETGKGGSVTIFAGGGGEFDGGSTTGDATGGKGGLASYLGGDGADALIFDSANSFGGDGGNVNIGAGDGGLAFSNNAGQGGDGGDVTIVSGSKGVGFSGAVDGSDGAIIFTIGGPGGTTVARFLADASGLEIGSAANHTKITSIGDMNFVGSAGFYPRLIRQDDEPANGIGATQIDDEEMIFWIDTNDGNKIYMIYNDNTNTNIVKIELT